MEQDTQEMEQDTQEMEQDTLTGRRLVDSYSSEALQQAYRSAPLPVCLCPYR